MPDNALCTFSLSAACLVFSADMLSFHEVCFTLFCIYDSCFLCPFWETSACWQVLKTLPGVVFGSFVVPAPLLSWAAVSKVFAVQCVASGPVFPRGIPGQPCGDEIYLLPWIALVLKQPFECGSLSALYPPTDDSSVCVSVTHWLVSCRFLYVLRFDVT